MRRLYQGIIVIILAGLSLYLNSCTLKSCFDVTESKVKSTFYSIQSGKALSPDSLTLYGMNKDTSKIYHNLLKAVNAEFPLFATDTSVKFIIGINGIYDSLEFRYKSYLHLISKECGYTYYFNLDTVIHTAHIIDSVSILKNTITNKSGENMRIYY